MPKFAVMTQLCIGDIVRIGTGRNQWEVVGTWQHGTTTMVDLVNPEKRWVKTSATPDRLILIGGPTR